MLEEQWRKPSFVDRVGSGTVSVFFGQTQSAHMLYCENPQKLRNVSGITNNPGLEFPMRYIPALLDTSGGRCIRTVLTASSPSSSPCVMGSKRGGGPLVSVGEVAADWSVPIEVFSGAISRDT